MALAPTDVASIEESAAVRLVTAHRDGDRDAFAEIVRTHYSSLLATARHRLRNSEDAKDAVQETLLRALVALDRFGDTGDWRIGAWLNTILIHVCADIPARRKPTAPLSDWLIETCPDPSEVITSDPVALAAVEEAIDALPDAQRRAFELRLVDGLPYEEVAGVLGITEVNARARVRRARTALQHTLESTEAVKGAWAAVPLFLTAPVRSVLRRLFAGAQDTANAAGTQALASAATSPGSAAASAIAGTPVETGIQLITQVSATPLGQAVVASATSVPGKGSVVLGIVAGLATAGGLSAPAVISGSTAGTHTPPAHTVSAMPAASPTSKLASTSPATTPLAALGSVVGPAASTSGSKSTSAPHTPWVTLAASSTAYRASSPSSSAAGTTPTASTGTSTTSTSTTSTSTTGTSTTGTSTTPPAGGTGTNPTGKTTPSSTAGTAPGSGLTLPVGTCTGVTGFPGVTAPSSVPPLSSSGLGATLSTGSLGIATVAGSPAFGGTAIVKGANSTAPVQVKVGTCLAEGGSVLAVDLTGSTGDAVQLVGSLVAQPFTASTGADAYLFRGNVTQLAGTPPPSGGLPWGLTQGFVAEVLVQPKSKTGSLDVYFLQPSGQTPTGSPVASTTPGSATSTSLSGTGATTTTTAGSTPPGAGTTAPPATTSSGTSSSAAPTTELRHPLMVGGGSATSV